MHYSGNKPWLTVKRFSVQPNGQIVWVTDLLLPPGGHVRNIRMRLLYSSPRVSVGLVLTPSRSASIVLILTPSQGGQLSC